MAFYWVGWSLEIVQKNYLPYLIHFGVILQRTYVATFLTIAVKNVSRVTYRLDELKNIFFALRHIHHV